jgi:hypothetical protein
MQPIRPWVPPVAGSSKKTPIVRTIEGLSRTLQRYDNISSVTFRQDGSVTFERAQQPGIHLEVK